ncbi:unnamed protein product [Arctia plantaginis]|uniref:Uncharacterized protein n=1 Tax=Arctia plantaginis TaxID=874455 RepID=A0A8S0YV75_ARCPL|nr:unnamed protein product [Arctia plantaginis]CAB3247960.1 unnamed protein product [Arctia plantaginis]
MSAAAILLIGAVAFTAFWSAKYIAKLYSYAKQKEGKYFVTHAPPLRMINPTYFPMAWERLRITTTKPNLLEYLE